MAITNAPFTWYNKGILHLTLDKLLTDDIRVILLTNTYTPDSATHEYYDVDITGEHTTGSGYTIGGQTLTTPVLDEPTPGFYNFQSDDPLWNVTGTNLIAKLYALYNNTPASNKPLIGYAYLNWNGGTPLDVTTAVGFPFSIAVPALGWFRTVKIDGV